MRAFAIAAALAFAGAAAAQTQTQSPAGPPASPPTLGTSPGDPGQTLGAAVDENAADERSRQFGVTVPQVGPPGDNMSADADDDGRADASQPQDASTDPEADPSAAPSTSPSQGAAARPNGPRATSAEASEPRPPRKKPAIFRT